MKTLLLSNEERAASGFTHKAILSFAQGDFSAAAVSQSYTLDTLAVGQIIQGAARKDVTDIVAAGASAGVAVLGDGGTANLFLTSKSVFGANTPIPYQAGDGAGLNQAGGTVYTTASTLILALTLTGANVSTITAGEIHIYWKKADLLKV